MTLPPLRRIAVQIVVVLVALAAVLTSGAPAQSLGDVAKQEEARRKTAGFLLGGASAKRRVNVPLATWTKPGPWKPVGSSRLSQFRSPGWIVQAIQLE